MTAYNAPTQDERILAALAHVTAILPFTGLVAPIVIWVTQREKSAYVAFQSLQALAYQLTMILAWFLGMACYMCSCFAMFVSVPLAASASGGARTTTVPPIFAAGFLFPFVIFGALIIGGIVFTIYALVAAVRALQGKDFRYLIIGNRIEQY